MRVISTIMKMSSLHSAKLNVKLIFVAKNEDFLSFANDITNQYMKIMIFLIRNSNDLSNLKVGEKDLKQLD